MLGPCSVWAVGSSEDGGQNNVLVQHWNGSRWRTAPTPTPGSNDVLFDVSPSWAVGFTGAQTLALRRVGTSWGQVATPNPSATSNNLQGVVQLSSKNAWAVGSYQGPSAVRTLVLHWNGSHWKRIASPNVGGDSTGNALTGIAAASARDIWAVGYYGTVSGDLPLVLHWNGKRWKVVTSPAAGQAPFGATLSGVGASSADRAWAAGSYYDGTQLKALVLRWNGAKWKRVKPLGLGAAASVLEDVLALSDRNVWIVGEDSPNNLVLHWNGRNWKKVAVGNPGTLENIFRGIDASSKGEIWAVGAARDTGPTPYYTQAQHCC